MKKILVCLMVMVCLLGLAGVVYGNSGSSYISHWGAAGTVNGQIFISNITNSPITVIITLYQYNDGSIFKNLVGYDVQNFTTNITNASATFTLNANTSGYIIIPGSSYPANGIYGYGRIEWTQNGSSGLGLLANMCFYDGSNNNRFSIPVNNGLPF